MYLVLIPPLHLSLSLNRLSHLRETLASQSDDGAELCARTDQACQDWRAELPLLDGLLAEVRSAVAQADEARRGNPRALPALAEVLRRVDDPDTLQASLEKAEGAYDDLVEHVVNRPMRLAYLSGTAAVVVGLRHALDALTPREDGASSNTPRPSQYLKR